MAHLRCQSTDRSENGVRSANRFAVRKRRFANTITLAALALGALSTACSAADLQVIVSDRHGRPVGDVVVTVTPLEPRAAVPASAAAAMDQRNIAFVPRVLVVAAGSLVDFPNNDTVSHQVYSFSDAKKFQLPLYKGKPHSPVRFDREGLVVLGCNIHDQMAGYIYVTSAPYFGKTDDSGTYQLRDMPSGDYRVKVWSPFIADADPSLTRSIHVKDQEASVDRIELIRELRTRPEPRPRRSDWDY